ncbi:FtsQ-type POTRA domain-containing protein [Microbacterium gubbeenense]|uniref:FtsQ-type POTRA domain-containing protein n=2 Tax=Microbacterium gubbeenense TaxID=159896 RepID=UPI003F9EB6BD
MKRPTPIPPRQTPPAPDEDDFAGDEPDEAPARGRLGSILPFGRSKHADVGDEDDGAEPTESKDPDAEKVGLRRLGWRRKRAERAEVRRFTARSRRRRIIWLSSVGAVVLLAIGTIGAAYSPLFAVEKIEVVGASALDVAAVEASLEGQKGRPLPLIDRDEIRAALTSFPLVETFSIEPHPPHELIVRVEERTPVAVMATDAGFTTVDAAGVALDTAEAQPEGVPIAEVEDGPHSDVFAEVGQVLRALPEDLAKRISVIRATSPEDVTFDLPDGGGVTVVWGSAGDTAEKIQILTAAFSAAPPDTVSTYDVSSAGVLVVK